MEDWDLEVGEDNGQGHQTDKYSIRDQASYLWWRKCTGQVQVVHMSQ